MAKIDDATWERWKEEATRIGTEQGTNAAGWVQINDEDTARRLITGMDDGDPAIMDGLPHAPSGEFADDYSPRDLYKDLGTTEDSESDDMELFTIYQDAYNTAVHAELYRRGNYQLEK